MKNAPVADKRDKTIPKPPARLILTTPEHFLAFGFGSGLAPKAPGTFGTLAALPFWWAMSWLPLYEYLLGVIILFAFGCWVCHESARLLGVHDYGGIVFDEIVGFLITCIPLVIRLHPNGYAIDGGHWEFTLVSVVWLAVAFGLFRFFDIIKPWPIRVLDRSVHGGFGIMIDDVIAGLFAAGVLELLLRITLFQ